MQKQLLSEPVVQEITHVIKERMGYTIGEKICSTLQFRGLKGDGIRMAMGSRCSNNRYEYRDDLHPSKL